MGYADRFRRQRSATIGEVVHSLTHSPYTELGDLYLEDRLGRRRRHPGWVPVVYCALARHLGSYNRLDAELADGLWAQLLTAADDAGLEPAPLSEPFRYHHHAYWRDLIMSDDSARHRLLTRLTEIALEQARRQGLLLPHGPGSITHPHRRRLIYGDGTILRPRFRYRPDNTGARNDPSAATHTRHDGHIWGNNYVLISARGEHPYSRVVLAIGRVPEPGGEAATAIELIQHVHQLAGPGIVGVAYDGAFQGAHHDKIMRTTGLVVINKPHVAVRGDEVVVKRHTLGTYTHTVGRRNQTCSHQLAAVNGRIADIEITEDGTPAVVAWANRHQVKRARRADGTYRFNMVIRLTCRHHNCDWDTWLSPHDDPEHIRLLPPDDIDFDRLYAVRPDAESLNSSFKASLVADRAPSIGWQRQLYDVAGFTILHNATNLHRHTPDR